MPKGQKDKTNNSDHFLCVSIAAQLLWMTANTLPAAVAMPGVKLHRAGQLAHQALHNRAPQRYGLP
eukprot:1145221-Pelagomonas_calceolata.AAC.3